MKRELNMGKLFEGSLSKENTAVKFSDSYHCSPELKKSTVKCNCKNSKCLKLYCECFR